MIIFLYGPDTYRSGQKLNSIIEDYKKIQKTGLNFSVIDFEESDFENFRQVAESSSMFKGKKLIVLKNLFSNENVINGFLGYLKKGNIIKTRDEIIIIYGKDIPYQEFKENKKELFKKLTKEVKSQEFKLLGEIALKGWIKKEFELKNVQIDSAALGKLVFYVGNDLWQMQNEIKKLILFKNGKGMISENEIDLLIKSKIETNIFKTIDAIASGNKRLTFKFLREHERKGESENYILSMILWQFRNLIKVKSQAGTVGGMQIEKTAKKLHLHPYVFEKSLGQSRKFSFGELKKIYQKLLEVDYKIKTGKIEPKAALNLFISEIC